MYGQTSIGDDSRATDASANQVAVDDHGIGIGALNNAFKLIGEFHVTVILIAFVYMLESRQETTSKPERRR